MKPAQTTQHASAPLTEQRSALEQRLAALDADIAEATALRRVRLLAGEETLDLGEGLIQYTDERAALADAIASLDPS